MVRLSSSSAKKTGWQRHAFLYSRDGKELALLTPGEYDIIDRGCVDEAGGSWFYFYASPDNGTQKYLYRVPLDGTGTLETRHAGRPTRHARLRFFSGRQMGLSYVVDAGYAARSLYWS